MESFCQLYYLILRGLGVPLYLQSSWWQLLQKSSQFLYLTLTSRKRHLTPIKWSRGTILPKEVSMVSI